MENLNQLVEQIKPAMEKMAEQLGVASEFLWGVLIKQQYIDGIMGIFWFFVSIILLIVGVKLIKPVLKRMEEDDDWIFGLVFLVIPLIIFGFFFGGYNLEIAVNHLVNPEYQAIKDIFEFIKGSVN